MNLNHPQLLGFLASASLILLFGFLVFWNIENFNRERIELKQDLKNQMTLACGEYRDNVVQSIFKIIKIDSSLGMNGQLPSLITHDRHGDNSESFVINSSKPRTRKITQSISVGDHDTLITVIVDTTLTFNRKDDIIAWRNNDSSTLRIEYTRDTRHEKVLISEDENEFITDEVDVREVHNLPNVFNKIDSIFIRRLKESGLGLTHKVLVDTGNTIKSNRRLDIPFEHESFGLASIPVARFSDFNGFLWAQMMPSVLLSLILFSVIAISFFIILRSWISQTRLTRIKNEFISNMTHELKTPISTVGVALEALENFGGLKNPVKRKEYLEISKHEINRLKILVDKVLKMSTLDDEEGALMTSEVDVRKLTDEMLNSMQLHFEKFNVQLDYRITGENFKIHGDKVHLTNVFYNLIDNAIKYSSKDPVLSVFLSENDLIVKMEVKDSGSGIPKEYLSKVFDRFFRVPSDNIHNVKGHGLGLHYVRTVINKHGGQVSVESSHNIGTTFTIQLPKRL